MYYKIITGFTAEDYIEIKQDELEKAYYCFLAKKDGVFSGGAIRGSQINSIRPDYHRTMGWNRGYKLEAMDYDDLRNKGIDRKMQLQLEGTKDKVQFLIESKQENLIGKGFELPKLNEGVTSISASIAEKFANGIRG